MFVRWFFDTFKFITMQAMNTYDLPITLVKHYKLQFKMLIIPLTFSVGTYRKNVNV